jgi:uncharacterized protein (TIGR02145 family)
MDNGFGFVNLVNSSLFSGVGTSSLTVKGSNSIDGYAFRCIATSCQADTSNAATLTVTSSATAAAGTVAGVPGFINYQGSALDSLGKPMKNQTIALKLSVVDSSSSGAAVFVESHSAATNGSGHFAIQIGGGTALLGTFDSVGWSNGRNKYLKSELSQNGTWVNLGTSQLVSVPYALHAGSAEVAKSAEQLQVGTLVRGNSGQSYQLEIGKNGPVWTCSPSVPQANAGPDQLNICGDTVILNGNSYNGVNSSWKILTGTGGNILGNLFTGIRGKSYSIQYSLTNVCGSSFDTLLISLALPIIQASAGPDQLNVCSSNVTLRGNTAPGTGSSWTIFSGFGGTVVGNTFAGIRGNAYSLRYTLTNVCGTSLDTLQISLALPVSQADAGAEQRNVCGDTVTLGGNTSVGTTSNWSIIFAGSSGTIIGNTFTGTRGYSYSLVYTLSNSCGSSFDTMQIFLALPASQSLRANAGPDQISLPSTMAYLAANSPAFGETGFWTIISGIGGTLGNANDPASTITKGNDSTYTLVWTINNPCIISYDTVIVSFQNLLMNVACPGIPSVNYGGTMYPTVQIGTQCWLAKNLDVGNMIPGAFNQTNNAIIEKYCYDNDTSNCTTYGGLYQWGEAMQYLSGNVRGICPTGWHISSDWEWCTLTTFLDITVDCSTGQNGTDIGNKLRSTSSLWYGNNSGATNASGFSALPGGFRNTLGTFENRVGTTTFWTSLDNGILADYRSLSSGNSSISHDSDLKTNGFSIRCLKD